MTKLQPAENITATIQGEVSGQIAVGNYNLQIGSIHGGIVQVALPEQQPQLQARPRPVRLLPRRPQVFLDREDTRQAAQRALASAEPVGYHAAAGFGKTSLLRYLAHEDFTASFPDGVVYLLARAQPAADLLQSIFDAFFEYGSPAKPSYGTIRQALQPLRALIYLDDIALEREEVEGLFDAAPNCTFILAGENQQLWGIGQAVSLPGLPMEAARALLEHELGRPITDGEREGAEMLLDTLQGHPLSILQAAALVRSGQAGNLQELASSLPTPDAERSLTKKALKLLSQDGLRLLASIAALDGAPLHERHIPALVGIGDPQTELRKAESLGLLQAHSPRYTLTGRLPEILEGAWDLGGWRERSLSYFHEWAVAQDVMAEIAPEDSSAVLRLVQFGLRTGRLNELLKLVRAVEGKLVISKRWGAWSVLLRSALEAAQRLGDNSTRAWALHQLGTRALCLGQMQLARTQLIRALRLREALGEREAAQVTRHNLNHLLPPGGGNGSRNGGNNGGNGGGGSRGWNIGSSFLQTLPILLLVVMVLIGSRVIWPMPPAIVPSDTPTPFLPDTGQTETSTFTLTPYLPATITPTGTSTASPTASSTTSPTATHTATPTITETSPPPPEPSCTVRTDWQVYVIQSGDTLYNIAQRTGTTVPALMQANCLNSTLIYTGQRLRVPRLPATATWTPTPTLTPSPTVTQSITPTITPSVTATATSDLVPKINQPPQVKITNPDGDVRLPYAGYDAKSGLWYTVIGLEGYAEDPEDGSLDGPALTWTGDSSLIQEGLPAEGRATQAVLFSSTCSPTVHTIILSARDSEGTLGSDSRQITIYNREGCSPHVEINEPTSGAYTYRDDQYDREGYYVDLTAAGRGWDSREQVIPAERLVWTNGQGELLGTGSGFTFRLHAKDYCTGASHQIILTATDAEGERASLEVTITISGGCTSGG